MAHILVTDDSNFLRRRTCTILKAAGHDTVEASNGNACMEAIAEHTPDAMFLDLVMPEMNGFEVLKALNEADYHFPVIVLTADIQATVKEECLQLGAAGFINKPPQQQQVITILDEVLACRKAN